MTWQPRQCSCLNNRMGRRACWATVYRITKSRTGLSDQHSKYCCTGAYQAFASCVLMSGRLYRSRGQATVRVCVCVCVCVCVGGGLGRSRGCTQGHESQETGIVGASSVTLVTTWVRLALLVTVPAQTAHCQRQLAVRADWPGSHGSRSPCTCAFGAALNHVAASAIRWAGSEGLSGSHELRDSEMGKQTGDHPVPRHGPQQLILPESTAPSVRR